MIARSKLVALLLTGALGVGVAVVGIVGTAAASGPGTAYVTPGTGNPYTALTLNTNGFCPAGNTNADVTVSGTGVTNHPVIAPNSPMPTAGLTGYSLQLTETMATFASEESPPATLSGTYAFTFNCLKTSTSLSPDTSFTGTIMFQGSGNSSTNTYTTAGTSSHPVFVPTVWGTVKVGSTVDCVQAVAHATSTSWSWYENAHKIAGATGSRYKIPSSLKGEKLACELSAKNSAGTTAETSTAAEVTGAGTGTPPVFVPTVWGTVKVGSTVDCVQAVAHATSTSWSWYENAHKIAGATGSRYKIPSSLKGEKLACELSAKNSAGTTAETSAAVKVTTA